eukprot:8774683-Prorocentrum_lima.AAC.1
MPCVRAPAADCPPIQEGPFDPAAALQLHLDGCLSVLNSALQQSMEEVQLHMQTVVHQALVSALDE